MHPPDSNERPREDGVVKTSFPDEISRAEHSPVSTAFSADTGLRTRRMVLLAGIALVVGFVIVSVLKIVHSHAVASAGQEAYSSAPPVDVITVHAAVDGQELSLPGETAAWYDATLYARVNGYVAHWNVDIGDSVKRGQVLATIETPELNAELSAAQAQLKSSEAQVAARKAEVEFAKTTNERWRDSPKGVVSEQERESKRADYESAEAKFNAANAQVALDKSRVDQYAAMTEFREVRAPFDGVITERKIDVGNLVTAGSGNSTTPLYRMAQTTPLRIFVDVPQSAAGELMNAGVPAEIRATGAIGGVFEGKTARSAESINAQARTMRVEVDMPNDGHSLVPGMYVTVAFKLPARGSVEVPAAALLFRAGATQVAEVGADGRVVFKDVTIARDNGTLVELASGAKAGDHLVLNISSQIAPGEPVTAHLIDNPSAAKHEER